MGSQTLRDGLDELFHAGSHSPLNQEAILDQLERVIQSTHFRHSKRYPALLSFIVQETLAGRTDSLKERTLGVEVFGRPIDYDTNADPVVRVTAGEVRKRIAQYYQSSGHEHELRFDLPLGSYVPHFLPPVELSAIEGLSSDIAQENRQAMTASASLSSQEHNTAQPASIEQEKYFPVELTSLVFKAIESSRKWKIGFLITLLVAIAAGTLVLIGIFGQPKPQLGIRLFWNPLLSSKETTLIVLGMHSFDNDGRDVSPASYASLPKQPQSMLSSMIRSDMVPVTDVVSYSQLTDLLTRSAHAYRTQGAAETTFDQLRRGPIILIGGFDNVWTMRLTSSLRFRLIAETDSIHEVQDAANPTVSWKFDNAQSALNNSRDYAIAGRFFDPQISQFVLFAAGIGQNGTAAAAEFLTSNDNLLKWTEHRGISTHANIEIVLSTEIIEGQHGPPQEVASYVW